MLTATFMITTALAAAPPLLAKENALPRNMTPAEQRWVQDHPIAAPRGMTSPPSGPIHCAAEYEPMDAILLAWEGSNSWKNILATMAANITTIGNADVVISIESSSEQTSALSSVVSAGADSSRVRFVNRTTDSIWIRDYGPRYIFEGDCRAIVDHTYNRPRPHDNAFNAY
ncbi:MAG: agmatine deiminase family protein, partial [Phycisphaerales bacterium]|nr:agmatine deiminase family protein [Phycisphaerales bacterium]